MDQKPTLSSLKAGEYVAVNCMNVDKEVVTFVIGKDERAMLLVAEMDDAFPVEQVKAWNIAEQLSLYGEFVRSEARATDVAELLNAGEFLCGGKYL